MFGSKSNGVTKDQVMAALATVQEPELHKDLVTLGMVKDVTVKGGSVSVTVELTTPACPLKEKIERECTAALKAIAGVQEVRVTLTSNVRTAPRPMNMASIMPGVKHVIAVGSGKGGVGKSTVAINTALALAESGATVGILDADIYGPTIPLMMGLSDAQPEMVERRLQPLERYGVKAMSIGMLLPKGEVVIWRGPMVGKMITEFLNIVDWGDLDYLVVDLPPGTGDASLSLVQTIPVSGAVIVTTPQAAAVNTALKSLLMFRRVNVPILGIVENMSYFDCPHCHEHSDIFGTGGGKAAAREMEVPYLGRIPLTGAVREGGDAGRPIMIHAPQSLEAAAFRGVAGLLAGRISVMESGLPILEPFTV